MANQNREWSPDNERDEQRGNGANRGRGNGGRDDDPGRGARGRMWGREDEPYGGGRQGGDRDDMGRGDDYYRLHGSQQGMQGRDWDEEERSWGRGGGRSQGGYGRGFEPDYFESGRGSQQRSRGYDGWGEERGGRRGQEMSRDDFGRGRGYGPSQQGGLDRDRWNAYGQRDQGDYGQRYNQGYGQGGYGQGMNPGYGQGGYGQGGYGQGGYGQGGYGQGMNPGAYRQGYEQPGGYGQGMSQGYGQGGYGQGQEGRGQSYGGRQMMDQGSGQMSGGFRGKGPKGYTRSDERLREEISDAFTDHDELDASDVEIKVEGGEVTLSGTVPNRQCKRIAEDVAERCSGIKEVHNQLRVKREDEGASTSREGQRTSSTQNAAAKKTEGGNTTPRA